MHATGEVSNCRAPTLTYAADVNSKQNAELFVSGTDVEGKASSEELITQEAASKSVHVLGQGN